MYSILSILAIAILLDIIFNDGEALSNIFKAIGTIFHKPQIPPNSKNQKLEFIQALKEEIDELYDDLEYDISTDEEKIIREKLKYKQDLINKLMND
jgi:hypothetical protein